MIADGSGAVSSELSVQCVQRGLRLRKWRRPVTACFVAVQLTSPSHVMPSRLMRERGKTMSWSFGLHTGRQDVHTQVGWLTASV